MPRVVEGCEVWLLTLSRGKGDVPGRTPSEGCGPCRRALRWLSDNAPRGWTLSDGAWRARHRGIVAVLCLHVVGVPVFGLIRGAGLVHVLLEASGISILALAAASPVVPRPWRTVAATLGLMTSSAVLVHLGGGSIEMHFHFFVMVPLVALYQDWVPFLVAIIYVVLHHGVAGSLDPGSVFNHPAALAQPWKWAAVHAFFITGISIVCLTTWRLLESALESAQAEARVKGEFLSIMSHEIRTPLTAVIGYAGLLSDTGLSVEQKQYADTIRRSGDRLLTLVNDILDYSKLEAGRLGLDEATFDMLRLVDDTVELVAETAHQRGVKLSSLVENSVPRSVIGDAGRISQVLLNLVSNAVKFTENGEVSVRVSAASFMPGRYEVVMEVRDTGIGLEPEDAERLFDAFTQAEPSTSRRFGGTGLGLPIARQLCELMGGTITVQSQPGEGAIFRASFAVRESAPESKRHDVDPSLAALRVLIVGEGGSTSLLMTYLTQWGIRPRTASPMTALLWARSGMRFDVVFLYRVRDGADPFAFAVELRTLLDHEITQIVLVAGPSAPIVVAGMFDAILVDPLRQSNVFDLLAAANARRSSQPEGTEEKLEDLPAERFPLRILVAEDNHVNQKVVLSHLKRLGYTADVVASGEEVLEAMSVRSYDLILMDVHMPEMDGITAARHLRERFGEGGPAVLALTADLTPEIRAQCHEAGMLGFVPKPIRESELRSALIEAAEGRPERDGRAAG